MADIETWFKEFDHFMNYRVPDVVAETALEDFRENFQTQSFNGVGWRPLSPKYARKKRRSTSRILTNTAALQHSMRETIKEPSRVRITAGNSKVPYARVHNEGYTGLQKVPTYQNRNFMGKGKHVTIKAHTRRMNIPKRQFMGRTTGLKSKIKQRIKLAFNGS